MAIKRTDAQWTELNPETLSPEAQAAYKAYKDIYKAMKLARDTFETQVRHDSDVAEGKRLVFGYNFGKLSVAVVDDDSKPAKASKAPQSLSAFLASQQAAGKRV
jgi:hypothetical protein